MCRCSIVSADYAHLELRIMAHFSQDQGLCRVLRDSQCDPFKMLAAQWQLCNPDEVRSLAQPLQETIFGSGHMLLALRLAFIFYSPQLLTDSLFSLTTG